MTTLPFHTKVSLDAMFDEDSIKTYNVSGGVTTADVGKAVTIDATAANTVKLVGSGDIIIGRLESVEVRSASQTVGAVARRLSGKFPIQSGQTVLVGDTVVGGAAGAVKSAASPNYALNFVVEVVTYAGASYAIVEMG